jgi:hypothetical protein
MVLIATIIARITRSGTLVGPGTNRKLRPGILGLGMVPSLRKRLSQSHRHSIRIAVTSNGFRAAHRCRVSTDGGLLRSMVLINAARRGDPFYWGFWRPVLVVIFSSGGNDIPPDA